MALGSRSAQTVQHMSLLRALACANASVLAQFSIPLIRLLNREVLLSPCASWQLRLAAICLLESLLKAAEQATLLSSQLSASLQTLAKCRLDKMPHIRKAAMNALRTADTLVAKGPINVTEHHDQRKQAAIISEDLSPLQSQTEPSSPLRHSVNSLCSIEELFKPTFSSPRSQHSSHGPLMISPHAVLIADHHQLPPPASSTTNKLPLRLQTAPLPASDYSSPGHVTTDDSDYFCAYFDTKENVSCRKIVHHIHDVTATGSATPPSPPRHMSKAAVASPLPPPPTSLVHDYSGAAKMNIGPQAQNLSAMSTPASSLTRQVTVLDSHSKLLASCEKNFTITYTMGAEGKDSHQNSEKPRAGPNCIASESKPEADIDPMDKYCRSQIDHPRTSANCASESKSEGNIDLVSEYSTKSGIEHIFTEQQMQAMEDLKAISDRLLEMREEEVQAEAEMRRKEDETRYVEQRQDPVDQWSGTPDTSNDHLTEEQNEKAAYDECLEDQASSHHETKDDHAGIKEEEAAETSSGEWSVRDNPIADAQMDHHQHPVPSLTSDGDGAKQDSMSAADDSRVQPLIEATELDSTISVSGQTCNQEETILNASCSTEDLCIPADDDDEVDDEVLESCEEDDILEADGEECLSPSSSLAGIDVKENGLFQLCKTPSASLRSIIIKGTACVVPIAIVTIAKRFNLGFPTQLTDSVHIFVPPT